MNILKKIDAKKTGIFAVGVLFGTAGIKASENSEFDDESETEVENDIMKTEE